LPYRRSWRPAGAHTIRFVRPASNGHRAVSIDGIALLG